MPPLRERRGDVPLLANYYIDRYNSEFRKRVRGLSPRGRRCSSSTGGPATSASCGMRSSARCCSPIATGSSPKTSRRSHASVAATQFRLPAEGLNLDEVERQLLQQALERAGGNQTQAGQLLGINRDQVRYRIEKFGLAK